MTALIDNSPAKVEYLMNGAQPSGSVAATLLRNGFNVRSLRPYASDDPNDPRSYVDVVNNGKVEPMTTNIPASLRFQDWRLIDEAIMRVAKPHLKAVGDLRSRGLEVSLANGLGYTVFSYENQSDISPAQMAMSPVTKTDSDRPVYDIVNLPIPVLFKDFSFDARQVQASRNGNTPLDIETAILATRRVAELAETFLLGVTPSYTYGGGTAYGFRNFPSRLTKTITAPTAGGWTPATMVNEVLAMRLQSQLSYHFGPWMLYTSPNLDQYLDADYSSAKGDNTLRARLGAIRGIQGVETIDYLQFVVGTPYIMLLVEMDTKTVRMVIALDFTTVQWPGPGGFEMNYKVMCAIIPQLRTDQNLNCGIVDGEAAYP